MMLETYESLTAFALELSAVLAVAQIAPGPVVVVFGRPIDASHQWRGRQRSTDLGRRSFTLRRPQRSPFDVRPRRKQSWRPNDAI